MVLLLGLNEFRRIGAQSWHGIHTASMIRRRFSIRLINLIADGTEEIYSSIMRIAGLQFSFHARLNTI